MARPCLHDPSHALPDGSAARRKWCSAICRTAAYRERLSLADAQFRYEAATLVRRQTAAIQAGDAEALAQCTRDALALFGPTS